MQSIELIKSIDYFKSLIDKNGIIQFTRGYEKDFSYGYAIEDQARALILSVLLGDETLVNLFFGLIKESQVKGKGVDVLRNKEGKLSWKTDDYTEPPAEVFWALSVLTRSKFKNQFESEIGAILPDLKKGLKKTSYPRVMAYTLLGLSEIQDYKETILYANKLVSLYKKNKDTSWEWFENKLTYANALMPWSLFLAYEFTKKQEYLDTGERTLHFLFENLSKDGVPIVVGNEDWWERGKDLHLYGQQPIDIAYMCLACLDAERATADKTYLEKAKFYFSWFTGNNLLKRPMLREDGACYDGLYSYGQNVNAGAESNICFLLSCIQMKNKGLIL